MHRGSCFLVVLALWIPLSAQVWQPHAIGRLSPFVLQPPAAVDADQDGDLDLLAIADSLYAPEGGYLLVAENVAGDSSWNAQVTSIVVHEQHPLRVMDMDADGDDDVCTVREIFRNDGNLTFTSIDLQFLWDTVLPHDGPAAMLDGDAYPDMVSRDANNGELVVLYDVLGPAPQVVAFPAPPDNNLVDVVAGDLDGDGLPDVVTVGYTNITLEDSVHWYRNLGGGVLDAPLPLAEISTINSTGAPNILGLQDMDGDSDNDLVLDHGWFRNMGGGVLGPMLEHYPAWAVSQYGVCQASHCVDVDLDGDIDVGGWANADQDFAFWMENDGTGTFALRSLYWTAHADRFPQVADLQSDGSMEFLSREGASLHVRRMVNDTMMTDAWPVHAPMGSFAYFDHDDADGDGDEDLLLTEYASIVRILYNDGNGEFQENRIVAIGERILTAAQFVDFDNDGDEDVLVGQEGMGGIALYRNANNAFFGDRELLHADSAQIMTWLYLATGDLNGDQYPDVVKTPHNVFGVAYFANLGGTGLAPPQILGSLHQPGSDAVDIADMDGNGWNDIVFATPGTGWAADTLLLIPNLNGTDFDPAAPILLNAEDFERHSVVDVDGDLDPDVLGSTTAWTENNGGGSFSPQQWLAYNYCGFHSTWGDVTGDNIPDMISAQFAPRLGVLAGSGGAVFDPDPVPLIDSSAQSQNSFRQMRVVDINGDGLLDPVAHEVPMFWWFELTSLADVAPKPQPVIAVWPNPAVAELYISLGNEHVNDHTVELIDVQGRVVQRSMYTGAGPVSLDVHRLPAGIYAVRVSGPEGALSARVMVGTVEP